MRTSVIDEPDTNGLKKRERQAEESRPVETNLRKLVFGTGSLFDSEALEKVVNYEVALDRGGTRKVHGVAGGA
ncbi:hypothetical protein HK104_002395 [Borealophlyctis nickersoniae]|nr:hypothetical protein HK104_002395 [Borealophlyctis nickersoniae]